MPYPLHPLRALWSRAALGAMIALAVAGATPALAGTYRVVGTCGLWDPYNADPAHITVSRADFDGDRVCWFPHFCLCVCRRSRPLSVDPESAVSGFAGAFALNARRVEAICGPRRERRDRSVAGNRGLSGESLLELDRRDVAEGLVQAAVVEPADVFDERELELGAGAPDTVGDQLGLEGVDEALGERVVIGIPDGPDRREHAVIVEHLREVMRRVLGGFQRSSQRSMMEGCDGQAEGVGCAADGAAGDAFAGTASGRSARASSAVLGGDRAGRAQRRGRCRGGRVAGRRRPVVSGGWRHTADRSGSAVQAVPVVRRARGDRGVARRWFWGARGRAAAGSLAVDDLARVAA